MATNPLRRDWELVLGDVREALAAGREPEEVQAERHARERAAVEAKVRWWEYVAYFGNPRVFLPRLAGTEWDECWSAWPHCNGQTGCWMHYSDPPTRWCGCSCAWCRIARLIRRDLP